MDKNRFSISGEDHTGFEFPPLLGAGTINCNLPSFLLRGVRVSRFDFFAQIDTNDTTIRLESSDGGVVNSEEEGVDFREATAEEAGAESRARRRRS